MIKNRPNERFGIICDERVLGGVGVFCLGVYLGVFAGFCGESRVLCRVVCVGLVSDGVFVG